MSERILLSDNLSELGCWDAQLVDFENMDDLAKRANVSWFDHVKICATPDYMKRAQEFIDIVHNARECDGIIDVTNFSPWEE